MSIRTAEQLSDRLATDLAWRKKELSEMKSLIEAKNVSDQRHQVLVRSGVCILYSHWEGFVKLAANSYLEYVISKRLTYQELSSNFLALAMKEKIKEAKETHKPSLYIPVCEFFLSELHQRSIPPKEVISTGSNLNSEIFKEITYILGIDFSISSQESVVIDIKLVKTRNEIAHGEYSVFNRDAYLELHRDIIGMLNKFRNQIENAAIQKKFRRDSP